MTLYTPMSNVLKPLNTNSDDLSHLRLASTFSSSRTTRQDIAATEHTRTTTLFTGIVKEK